MALVNQMKQLVRDKGLQASIRVQKAGCLDVCNFGPGLVVYPEGTFYGHVTPELAEEIINKHLVGGTPVHEAVLSFPLPEINGK